MILPFCRGQRGRKGAARAALAAPVYDLRAAADHHRRAAHVGAVRKKEKAAFGRPQIGNIRLKSVHLGAIRR